MRAVQVNECVKKWPSLLTTCVQMSFDEQKKMFHWMVSMKRINDFTKGKFNK